MQLVDNAPCPDLVTLPAENTRDIHYAASQQIYVNKSTVACNVLMKLTAGQQIIIQDSLYLPSSCGVPAYVHAYQGPCPPDKYTEGFNQQSATGQYTYDNSGNLGFDPNKKVTYYYNYLNLPYKITGSENDETQFLYGADGSLLQRKYI